MDDIKKASLDDIVFQSSSTVDNVANADANLLEDEGK